MTVQNKAGIGISAAGRQIVKRNIIKGNNAEFQGGGIWIVNFSDVLIVQNLITGNHTVEGGGIYWSSPVQILVNNTIADNNVTTIGSGVLAQGIVVRTELTNNIIVANPGQSGLHCGNISGQNRAIIRFNNIFSAGGVAYGGDCSDRTGTNGNISADPLFTNPAQGDYHLRQGSPSIDSGDNQAPNLPDKDLLDEDPRILDGDGNGTVIIDMGVDEFLLPLGLKISLLDESNRNSKNIRSLSICDLRPWARPRGKRPINTLSARSPRLRVK